MTQLQCHGEKCSYLRLQCAEVLHPYQVHSNTIFETPYFSEEIEYGACPSPSYFLVGMKCTGQYCDNISLRCARITETLQDGQAVKCSGASDHAV